MVSSAAADMIDVSTQNGQVLESGPAASLLQVSVHHTQYLLISKRSVFQGLLQVFAVNHFARSSSTVTFFSILFEAMAVNNPFRIGACDSLWPATSPYPVV